ncbi:AMP-binding protein [Micromonospora sp. FIMYZ51]|uniref:AMP-binding protein n=1 Tax=Micromonospora sp. FIMYZ51 TaxID=3051832 RepID=UPI00311F2EAC
MTARELAGLGSVLPPTPDSDPYRFGERIERIIEFHAHRDPDAEALTQSGVTLTYGELVERAQAVARGLRDAGVRPEHCVPVIIERSPDCVVALLGVLTAGAAYAALDPGWPAARLRDVISGTRSPVVITPDTVPDLLMSQGGTDLPPLTDGTAAASVFYTSGSTGRPKGVLSPHRGTIRTTVDCPAIPLGGDTVFLQSVALPWDVHSFELWGPLLNGGRCVLLDRGRQFLDADLLRAAIDGGVNTLWLTSSLFNVFAEECPELFRRIRLLVVGGERVSPGHVRAVFTEAPGLRVVNGYGPAENTIFTTTHVIRPDEVADGVTDIPIGRPVPRTLVKILESGELAVGGDGLALGYLGDEEETARRFFEADGVRFYRTGDLVELDEHGQLRYRGRADRQFKIRGVRIEPGEVETVLEGHPGVASAFVSPLPAGDGAPPVLGCLYTTVDGGPPDEPALRDYAERMLISAMVPTRLRRIDRLPLNANGKVDPAAAVSSLVEPRAEGRDEPAAVPSATTQGGADDREDLVGVARRLLRDDRLTYTDDLLAAGATSLDAVRLAARIAAHTGARVTAADVYRRRSLERILADCAGSPGIPEIVDAAAANAAAANAATADAGPKDGPLSHAQQRFWLAETMTPGNPDNLVVLCYELVGPLDLTALAEAFVDVVRHHPVLRTTYPELDAHLPVQRVIPVEEVAPIVRVPAPPGNRGAESVAQQLTADWWLADLDLATELSVRARVCRIAEDRHLLALRVHHIAFDGWSETIFVRDLGRAYRARAVGAAAQLGVQHSYIGYANWERRQLDRWREVDLPYWQVRLGEEIAPFLPRPTGTVTAQRRELTHVVDPGTVASLLSVAGRCGVPPSTTLLSAAASALARTFDVQRLCLGTVSGGRVDPASEALVGYLVNPLAIPLRGIQRADPIERLRIAGGELVGALEHAGLPFDELVSRLGPERGRHPWFQAWVVLQAAPPAGWFGDEVRLRPIRIRPPRTSRELTIEAIPDHAGRWTVVIAWRDDGLDAETASTLREQLISELSALAAAGHAGAGRP